MGSFNVKSKYLFALWWLALAGGIIYFGTRYHERRNDLQQATKIQFEAPVATVELVSGDTVTLFANGETFAALIISPTCTYCVNKAKVLGRRLEKIPANHRVIIAISFPDTVAHLFRGVLSAIPIVVPIDPAVVSGSGVTHVPTLVVTAGNGSVIAAHVGVPSRRKIDRIKKSLASEMARAGP